MFKRQLRQAREMEFKREDILSSSIRAICKQWTPKWEKWTLIVYHRDEVTIWDYRWKWQFYSDNGHIEKSQTDYRFKINAIQQAEKQLTIIY